VNLKSLTNQKINYFVHVLITVRNSAKHVFEDLIHSKEMRCD